MTATKYFESEARHKAKIELARLLGIEIFQFSEIFRDASGKRAGQYGLPDSRKKAERAMLAYKRMDEETEGVLLEYELENARVKSGKQKLKIESGRCGICHQESRAGYSACAVCLDVYHEHARAGFLKSLDSCTALQIIDGI